MNQKKNFKRLQQFEDSTLSSKSLQDIKDIFIDLYPNDYSLALRQIKKYVKEYDKIQNSKNLNDKNNKYDIFIDDFNTILYTRSMSFIGSKRLFHPEEHNIMEKIGNTDKIQERKRPKEWSRLVKKFIVEIKEQIQNLIIFQYDCSVSQANEMKTPNIFLRIDFDNKLNSNFDYITLKLQLNEKNTKNINKIYNEINKIFFQIFPNNLIFSVSKINESTWEFATILPLKFINDDKIINNYLEDFESDYNNSNTTILSEDDQEFFVKLDFILDKIDELKKNSQNNTKYSDERALQRFINYELYPDAKIRGSRIFRNIIINYIKQNPGVKQSEFLNQFPKSLSNLLGEMIYFSAKDGLINRDRGDKKSGTYNLYIGNDKKTKAKDFIENYPQKQIKKSKSRDQEIPTQNFGNSKWLIVKYFSKEIVNTIFETTFNKDKRSREMISRKAGYNHHYNSFLSEIGCSLKIQMSDNLMQVINKYWSKECEDELKRFLIKYGFFSDELFTRTKFREIIGEKNFSSLFEELAEVENPKIKWCGYYWPATRVYHIPLNFIKSFKFKWKMKPKVMIKKCLKCHKSFVPVYDLSDVIFDIDLINPHINHINDVDFCRDHALAKHNFKVVKGKAIPVKKERMIKLLNRLVKTVGVIPPSTFKTDFDYLKSLDKKTYNNAIKILCDMPPCNFKSYYTKGVKYSYKEVFGSWFKSLIAAGVLEDEARKGPRGYTCLAEDGHECLSIGEKNIDDWFYRHGLKHEKEPKYPGTRRFRGDWKVGKYYVEYWGLKGQEEYDEKILLKKELVKKYNLKLIEINPEDINNLDKKLKILMDQDKIEPKKNISKNNKKKEIIELKRNDSVILSQNEKFCIRVNNKKTINCKYFKVKHPDKGIQKIIDKIEEG